MKNQALPAQNQRGSVIIWILVLIALFGALSFVMSQGSRSGSGQLTQEKARLAATEIIAFHTQIRDAIKTLRINGCSETQISFQSSYWSDASWYDNTSSPTDKRCYIFDSAGGGLRMIDPPVSPLSASTAHYFGQFFFPAGSAWTGHGTTCTSDSCVDLLISLNDIPEQVCIEINKMAGIEGMPFDTTWGGSPFSGTYTYSETLGESAPAVSGKNFACFEHSNGAFKTFYSFAGILIIR